MADQFDIVDIVYNAIEPASTGFILYKDQSGDGEKRNHITIRSLALNGKDYVNCRSDTPFEGLLTKILIFIDPLLT